MTLLSNDKFYMEDFFKFCGLLRISKLYKHDCTKQQYVPNEALGLLCGIIAVMVIEGVKLTTTLFSTYVINSEFWVLGFEF